MSIFRKQTFDKQLIGRWESDLNDIETKNSVGEVTMHFTSDGKLIYEIKADDKIQRINLTYKTMDGLIISDQPSSHRVEKTKYKIDNDNILTLEFEGKKTKFIRTNK